jgi:hypothetical protein
MDCTIAAGKATKIVFPMEIGPLDKSHLEIEKQLILHNTLNMP